MDEQATLTILEASRVLGVSRNSCYAAAQRGELEGIAFRLGSRWVVSRPALARALAEGRLPAGANTGPELHGASIVHLPDGKAARA